ncbi:MAG: tRNA (guanosine(46)-N7)-methyltransferase TrmB [Bacteroidia bacterium]
MARRKQHKKDEYFELPNCFAKGADMVGKWNTFFQNDNPITLELGCGTAALSRGMAERFPDRNFIGIDLKPDRLWKAAKECLAENRSNIGFLHLHLLELAGHFGEGEVSEIWITFPDPFPKAKQAKHRMINPSFLKLYHQILKKDGVIRFKTDNRELFLYALEIFVAEKNIRFHELHFDLHNANITQPEILIQTDYEKKFIEMGLPINYVCLGFV